MPVSGLRTTVVGSFPKPPYLPAMDWFQAGHDTFNPHQWDASREGHPEAVLLRTMPLCTTVVGAFPKPAYLPLPDWFTASSTTANYVSEAHTQYMEGAEQTELQELLTRARREILGEQTRLGVDVITDGEVARENYIFAFCRNLTNFDFKDLTYKEYRNGACKTHVPTVRGPVAPGRAPGFVAEEWRAAQAETDAPVKITLPGPMTIINTTYNAFYSDVRALSADLVKCVQGEVRALVAAGCRHIQIDEPVLVRDPDTALEYGIDHLNQCFEGVGPDVMRTVHLCCGYPRRMDDADYPKADQDAYRRIATRLDDAQGFDAVSLEDAHRHNDLSLFSLFKKKTVLLGVVAIADSRLETVEEIQARVGQVLQHIPKERLWLAPDCGLGFLPRDLLRQKLANMVAAAKAF